MVRDKTDEKYLLALGFYRDRTAVWQVLVGENMLLLVVLLLTLPFHGIMHILTMGLVVLFLCFGIAKMTEAAKEDRGGQEE